MFFPDFNPTKQLRKSRPEVNSGHDKVERYGYIPFAKRVQQMEQAGINLLTIRAEMCDFRPEDNVDWEKDFRRLNDFDKFQAIEMQKQVEEKYQKLIQLQQQNAMVKQLTELGYSVKSAEEIAKETAANDKAGEQNNPPIQS